ncbi:MAG TPA: protein kinase [Polyangiaceae bacterium]
MTEMLPEGAVVAERLQIVRVLGAGGMGAVYEVEHLITKHRRALKLLHAEVSSAPGVIERFLREASAAGRVGNPHIVETFDAGMTERGEPYIVMELLKGRSLAELLEARGALELAETTDVLAQACDGVQAAHAAGIVHRDLKPDNLFLVEGERPFVKIVDFGISKFDPGKTGTSSATVDGSVMGTPYYMSPEQVRGAKHVEAASDIYALGVVLYECLVGRRPFEAQTLPQLAILIHEGKYERASALRQGLPPVFDEIIARALAPQAKDRFPSAGALAAALRRASEGTARTLLNPLSAPPPREPSALDLGTAPALSQTAPAVLSTSEEGPRAPARNRAILVVAGVGALGALAAALAIGRSAEDSAPAAELPASAATRDARATEAPSAGALQPQVEPSPTTEPVRADPAAAPVLERAPSASAAASARPKAPAPKPSASTTRARERGLAEENPF